MHGARGYIQLLATGGTISIGPHGPLRATNLIKMARRLPKDIPVRGEDVALVPSSALSIDHVHQLAQRVRTALDDPKCLGAVITHGTDTMQESALALELLTTPQKPVVLTGAMIPSKDHGADGPENVADAIALVKGGSTASFGVVVTMCAKVHSAMDVRKRHTTSTESFGSGPHGPIGLVTHEGVEIVRTPPRLALSAPALAPGVEIIRVGLATDGRLIELAADSGLKGIVIECVGVGHVPVEVSRAIAHAADRGCAVLLTSRVEDGPIEFDPEFLPPGVAPAIAAGRRLTPEAARILLMAMLGAGLSPREIAGRLQSD